MAAMVGARQARPHLEPAMTANDISIALLLEHEARTTFAGQADRHGRHGTGSSIVRRLAARIPALRTARPVRSNG